MRIVVLHRDDKMKEKYPHDFEGRIESKDTLNVMEALAELGHKVIPVCTSAKAILTIKELKPDIVFNLCDDGLGFVPRIFIASLIAYFAGGFSNSFVLAKMKIITKGKHLWTRTIGSTIVGEGVDTLLFATIAFFGVLPSAELVALIVSNYVFKVGVEVLFTPLTYKIVGFLKREEKTDVFDVRTRFNPFFVE